MLTLKNGPSDWSLWNDTRFVLVADILNHVDGGVELTDKPASRMLYMVYNSSGEDAEDTSDGNASHLFAAEPHPTILKIVGSLLDVFELMDYKIPAMVPEAGIAVIHESYDEPKFAELGMEGSFSSGHIPIPLFPKA